MKKLIHGLGFCVMIGFVMMTRVEGVAAKGWFYPISNYEERVTVKHFGDLIDKDFYTGKEALFPGMRFYGYHAAVDLEALPGEENADVSVVAVTDGEIVYVGTARGYGGVILMRIPDDRVALYGHVDITAVPLSVGQKIMGGERIAILGDAFAANSGGERKHLHFGIYRGRDRYFLGHESTREKLMERWEDPTAYLKDRGVGASENAEPSVSSPESVETSDRNVANERNDKNGQGKVRGLWDRLWEQWRQFWQRLFGGGGE